MAVIQFHTYISISAPYLLSEDEIFTDSLFICNDERSMQIESKFSLSTKLLVEGPLRLKEEYIEGILESPTVIEETIPEQLKGAFNQAVTTVQQLPAPIRDAISGGLRIPLSKCFIIFNLPFLS